MLPLILASQIRKGIEDFLSTQFPLPSGIFGTLIQDFIQKGKAFKGPYLSLSLPFSTSKEGDPEHKAWFTDIAPKTFVPFIHQEQAFQRLCFAPDKKPRSTIVATGTGSGKTECFLYPLFDYARKAKKSHKEGIFAILLYPMNALATDQAERITTILQRINSVDGEGVEAIDDPVTVGLYIGGNPSTKDAAHPNTSTSSHAQARASLEGSVEPASSSDAFHIITDRNAMRDNPPNVLLTNYKMLDYLLVRPDDFGLWSKNTKDTLKYLVVDELHTFDGAQGTDLACLLRRLKARFSMKRGDLCCIGTSATLGSDAKSREQLLTYASEIFGEDFDDDSLITETRVTPAAFFQDVEVRHYYYPDTSKTSELTVGSDIASWLARQYELWFQKPLNDSINDPRIRQEIARELLASHAFRNVVECLGSDTKASDDVAAQVFKGFDQAHQRLLLESLCSLASHAFAPNSQGDRRTPFLHLIRSQLWIRELARLVVSVAKKPELAFASEMTSKRDCVYLPLVLCRECGRAGWLTVLNIQQTNCTEDLETIYRSFFPDKEKVPPPYTIFFPSTAHDTLFAGGKPPSSCLKASVCGTCGRVAKTHFDECPKCHSTNTHDVLLYTQTKENICPFCGEKHSWLIMGNRAASLLSTVVALLMESTANDDKKLITFSDNVQDSAHRAAFVGARTYTTVLRTSLQQYVQTIQSAPTDDDTNPFLLANIIPGFIAYWKQRLGILGFIAQYINPSMEWYTDWNTLIAKKEPSPSDGDLSDLAASVGLTEDALQRLVSHVEKRLAWEIINQYALYAHVGNSLENTGASMACVRQKALLLCAQKLQREVREMADFLAQSPLQESLRFLHGLLLSMRYNGAIFMHECIENLLNNNGNIYTISQKLISYMPRFGEGIPRPRFFTIRKTDNYIHVIDTSGKSWLMKWIRAVYSGFSGREAELNNDFLLIEKIIEKALTILKEGGILRSHGQAKPVFGIAKYALAITKDLVSMECSHCKRSLSVPSSESGLWEGAPCVRLCGGIYHRSPQTFQNFFGSLYKRGEPVRLFTAEHTGLLARNVREETEASFKREGAERSLWDYNLLSCTPTLEMGIDIGSLSTTIQCSVPPTEANYVQRIGRAGRANGNAFNVTIAVSQTHDLYFYADPLLMMSNGVTPPAVFLNAQAVLERQLIAFCFDRWVRESGEQADVPEKIASILTRVASHDTSPAKRLLAEQKFPYTLLRYIAEHTQKLYDDFVAMFPKTGRTTGLTPETKEYLHTVLFADTADSDDISLAHRLIASLKQKNEKREHLLKQLRQDRNKPKKDGQVVKKAAKHSLSINEVNFINQRIRFINRTPTYEFFTSESFLPNYAFPEKSVTLHCCFTNEQQGKATQEELVLQRGAARALTDFAPGNTFYACKRKIPITGLFFDQETEDWRFCPECSYRQINGVQTPLICPNCGSPRFGDIGQVKKVLRFTDAFAVGTERDTRLTDDAENRRPRQYVRQMLFACEKNAERVAFSIKDEKLLFGFEYVSKATLSEINFGPYDESKGITIAGAKRPEHGFCVCRNCGTLLDPNNATIHTCTHLARGKVQEALDICLLREFTTEALRLLLPFSSDSFNATTLASLVAAIFLGLKLRFGGRLSHLRPLLLSEPDRFDPHLRKQYLIIVDTVPGGTGYVKQLVFGESKAEANGTPSAALDGKGFLAVLAMALQHLENCPCADTPQHDGCYKCLLAYHNVYSANTISKREAIALLRNIVQHEERLEKVLSLDFVATANLFDSELEKRFMEALRRAGNEQFPIDVRRKIVNGKVSFVVIVNGFAWLCEQQVSLGTRENVAVPSKADFVFWPKGWKNKSKPIVVFTDGWAYHRNRIAKDIAQRDAIVLSGNFYVWSVTWDDVEAILFGKEDTCVDFVEESWGDIHEKVWKTMNLKPSHKIPPDKNNLALLLDFLGNPNADKTESSANAYVASMTLKAAQAKGSESLLKGKQGNPKLQARLDALPASLKPFAMQEGATVVAHTNKPFFERFSSVQTLKGTKEVSTSILLVFDDTSTDGIDPDTPVPHNEDLQTSWRGFLRAFNIFQYAHGFCAATRKGIENGVFAFLASRSAAEQYHADIDPGWNTVANDVLDDAIRAMIPAFARANLPFPMVGYEHVVEGTVVGMAELAWQSQKIGLVDEDNRSLLTYATDGWRFLCASDADCCETLCALVKA